MEEEISLRELIETLLKWKNLIILIFSATLLITFMYTFIIATPMYISEITVPINTSIQDASSILYNDSNMYLQSSDMFFEDNRGFINRLFMNYKTTNQSIEGLIRNEEVLKNTISKTGINISTTELHDKLQAKLDKDKLNIKITDTNPKIANKLMSALIESLNDFIANNNRNMAEQHLELMDAFIKETEQRIESLSYEISTLNQYSIEFKRATAELDSNNSIHGVLLLKKEQLKLLALTYDNKNISISDIPSYPNKPYNINKKLNLAIGGVLGLMLGVFVAFFIEYWKSTSSKDSMSV